jgi:hypothetical protein
VGQAWVSVHPMGDVRTHACLSCPVSSLSLGASQLIAFMETANAIPRKQTLRNWKSQDWIEHPSFGLGQVSESREDRLDIDFVNSGTRTILKSTELKPAVSPDPDCKFPRAKRVSRKVAAK